MREILSNPAEFGKLVLECKRRAIIVFRILVMYETICHCNWRR
jgi:hypothetical protein